MSDQEITTTVAVDAESTDDVAEDLLVEDVSIDGMCGVY
ncbi:mycofactocin precursor MftA [Haloechinothrix salitolerans]|uniref:Mycofactocin MftA n=1 Tax=Haloechinothrix salitolerans TaxID=926830 RepID=A0ABW2C320_9PSEU